jgi:hypothetical protein
VTLDGLVKLVEFGIAKVESVASVGASSMAGQPTMIMTPGYASPERPTGESSGKTSDIYSPATAHRQRGIVWTDPDRRRGCVYVYGNRRRPPDGEHRGGHKRVPRDSDVQGHRHRRDRAMNIGAAFWWPIDQGITFVEAGLQTRLYVAAAIESQYLWCLPVPVTAR